MVFMHTLRSVTETRPSLFSCCLSVLCENGRGFNCDRHYRSTEWQMNHQRSLTWLLSSGQNVDSVSWSNKHFASLVFRLFLFGELASHPDHRWCLRSPRAIFRQQDSSGQICSEQMELGRTLKVVVKCFLFFCPTSSLKPSNNKER